MTTKKNGTAKLKATNPKKDATADRDKLRAQMIQLGDLMNRLDDILPRLEPLGLEGSYSIIAEASRIASERFLEVAAEYVRTYTRG